MTREEANIWLMDNYPLTIVYDRYGGTYSHSPWLAFPLEYYEIPEDVNDDDGACMYFWENYKEPVGKGLTPDAAMTNLIDTIIDISNND